MLSSLHGLAELPSGPGIVDVRDRSKMILEVGVFYSEKKDKETKIG